MPGKKKKKNEITDYPQNIQGNDPAARAWQGMYDDEQNRKAKREGNLGSIYQTGDRIIDSANRIGENAVNKLEETGEKLRNIGSNIGDKVKKKIKK
tara:strand:- start:2387 stop:2674 length:288 start_codon:yes stop_codon:yes gene_type:complete